MKPAILSIVATLTTSFAQVTIQTPVNLEISEISYLDSIYGSLFGFSSGKPLKTSEDLVHTNKVNQQYASMSQLHLPPLDYTDDLFNPTMFGGIVTYAHFPHKNCFVGDEKIDIAILGAPFDTGVSYSPGARFGPEGIRSASRRLVSVGDGMPKNYSYPLNPYNLVSHNYSIVDCGDVPMSPFDNRVALNQLYRGVHAIHQHSGNIESVPKIITMGGDHTIALMAIKSAYEARGEKINVIHFDSHIDTWDPHFLGGGISDYMLLNHGTFLHYAHEKGYIGNTNYHVGMRAPFIDDVFDPEHDAECGFKVIGIQDIDRHGIAGVVKQLRKNFTGKPVYVSVDIDVLDPAYAPGTGTMEIGGLTTRELLGILDGLQGLDVVGCDVVEVSPPSDTRAEITSLAATAVIESFLKLLVERE